MPEKDHRKEFLLSMYNNLWDNINRHIIVVWQAVSVVVASFAVFALAEKEIINIDIAISLVILISAWLVAHVYDASAWFNRNQGIIVNIEKELLTRDDLKLIHPYFNSHRPNKLINHLIIQLFLGVGLAIFLTIFHFIKRVIPGFTSSIDNFEFIRLLPYLALGASIIFVCIIRCKSKKDYADFMEKSPGKELSKNNT